MTERQNIIKLSTNNRSSSLSKVLRRLGICLGSGSIKGKHIGLILSIHITVWRISTDDEVVENSVGFSRVSLLAVCLPIAAQVRACLPNDLRAVTCRVAEGRIRVIDIENFDAPDIWEVGVI